MDVLVIYPENREQLTALKAVMKAMKISFEQKSEAYPEYIINEVKGCLKQANEDALIPYIGIN